MTLKQLEVFQAVAETRSFSKGGEAVSLAQSTASQHIRALEEELGVRLFDRTATQVSLTEVGRLFYQHAVRISQQCSEAYDAVMRFQGLEQATLRVGASTIPAVCLIPDMLGRFSAACPGVRFELQQGDTREVTRLLQDEQVELAVMGACPVDESISFREIMTERIILVGRPDNMKNNTISLDQLQELPLVTRESGSGTRLATDSALQKAGVELRSLRIQVQLGSSEAVRRAVLGGAGYAFISSLAVGPELSEGALHEIRVEGLDICRSFYLAWRRGCSLSPAAIKFIQTLVPSAD